MEIRQLKYFLQVCEDKNLSKAAEHLFITQQGLSHSIKSMEKELGVVLFTRSNHGVRLTDTTEAIRADVEAFLGDYEMLRQKIQDAAKATKGEIKISIPPGVTAMVMPELMIGFRQAYPQIDLQIFEESDMTCEKMVMEEEVDLGCALEPVDQAVFDYYPFIEEDVFLFVNKRNPLSLRKTVSFEDLKDEKFLFIDQNHKWYYTFLKCCERAGFTPNIAHLSSQVEVLASLVQQNAGVTFYHQMAAARFLDDNTTIVPLDKGSGFNWAAGFITRKGRHVKYITRVLMEYILNVFTKKTLAPLPED